MTTLTQQQAGSVLTLQLNNPSKKNPLSATLYTEIADAIRNGEKDGAKVVVIKGSGDAFSAGYNLDPNSRADYASSNGIVPDVEQLRKLATLLKVIRRSSLPVISQVHGYCFAGGTDLMLASDISVVADDAKVGVPNVRSLGITILSSSWPMLIGPMRAKLMMFTGDWISGKQAAEWGLAALSQPADELESAVGVIAQRISEVPLDMLKVAKMTLNRSAEIGGFDSIIDAAVELDAIAHFSEPVVNFWKHSREEGLRAALKGREAPFPGNVLTKLLEA